MPKQKQTNDDQPVTLEEVNKTLDRVAKLQEESVRRTAEIDRQMAETDRQIAETDRKIEKTRLQVEKTSKKVAELAESEKRRDKRIGDLGNKFGSYTEELALPSIRRILNVNFKADFRTVTVKGQDNTEDLQLDAWGVARNGVKAVYLVEIKSKFEEKHFKQLRRQVARFRNLLPGYADYRVYQAVAAVKVNETVRNMIFERGIYLIDVSGGVFMLANRPDGFVPNGNLEGHIHSRGVPPLHSVSDLPTEGKQA